jgi:hypothetical protein
VTVDGHAADMGYMGYVGYVGYVGDADDAGPCAVTRGGATRATLANAGWCRMTPFNTLVLGSHGGAVRITINRDAAWPPARFIGLFSR